MAWQSRKIPGLDNAKPGTLQQKLDVLTYQFTDPMYEVFREAAAVILHAPPPELSHEPWSQEPS